MNSRTRQVGPAVLCLCLLVGAVACSDDNTGSSNDAAVISDDAGPDAPNDDAGPDGDTDGGSTGGLRLEGALVPTGGMSMSSSYTLSGHVSPAPARATSSSASFQLELAPATVESSE